MKKYLIPFVVIFASLGFTSSASAMMQDGPTKAAKNSVNSRALVNGTIKKRDLAVPLYDRLLLGEKGDTGAAGPQGVAGPEGPAGPQGETGSNGMLGAYYAVANYNAGNTNAGAIASVACSNVTDVAISGGVQTLGLDGTPLDNNTPVSSSFPGRMDYSTNTPRPDRLDGWIIQFGGNAGPVSDVAPLRVKVYALCLPGQDIPVVETFRQVD